MTTRDALIYLAAGATSTLIVQAVGGELLRLARPGLHKARRGTCPPARGVATPAPASKSPLEPAPPKPPQQTRPAPHPTTSTVPPWFAADTAVQMPAVRTTTNQRGSTR